MSAGRPCAVVVFAKSFHHVGVHYVDADSRSDDGDRVQLRRDGRVVWQGTAESVAEIVFFADRVAAKAFHFARGRGLQAKAGPAQGSTARSERSPHVEGVIVRIVED
jgi:hypothetical protein